MRYLRREQWKKIFICALMGFSSGMPLCFFLYLIPIWLRSDIYFVNFLELFIQKDFFLGLDLVKNDLIKPYLTFYSSSAPYWILPPIDLKTIGLFSLFQLPYTFKFLWAPILDRYMPFSIGRRRGWMLITQIGLLCIMASYAFFRPSTDMYYIIALTFMLTFFSATQDIVIDAFRREILTDEELGLGNAISVNTYRLAVLVPGSFSLILANMLPWSQVFMITSVFMFLGMLIILISKEPKAMIQKTTSLRDMILEPLLEYLNRKGIQSFCWIVAFIFLYKLGDALALSLSSVFYYDLGYSKTMIGTISKYPQLIASMIGGLVGGVLMLKIGINRALWLFGVVQITSILGFVWLASFGQFTEITMLEKIYLFMVVGYEYLGVGLGSAAFVAFIMRESNPIFAATQIALLTAISAAPRTFISSVSGYLVQKFGYYDFFLICFFLAIPGMLLLFKVVPWNQKIQLDVEQTQI